MTSTERARGSLSGITLHAVGPALTFTVVLLLVASTTPLAHSQTFTVLYTFAGGTDGSYPTSTMIRDHAGNFIGTTLEGGTYNRGTIFKLDRSGNERRLYSFTNGADGADPNGLIQDAAGNFYGSTYMGGDLTCSGGTGCGTVFKLDATGHESVLHFFAPDLTEGINPTGRLLLDGEGNLYGTTSGGGTYLCGTVFKLDTTLTLTVLYRFTCGVDGGQPNGGLVSDAAGNFYGTTSQEGAYGKGTVFKIDVSGAENVIYSFMDVNTGQYARSGLILDPAGNLYGTTAWNETDGGTVFKLTPNPDGSWTETVLHHFAPREGGDPWGDLILDAEGNLYGTTREKGNLSCFNDDGCGTVFKLSAAGKLTVLYRFTDGADGAWPYGGLVRDAAGKLYGTASQGGNTGCNGVGCGTVFEIAH